jgi:HPr kinase/phosphorylase
MPLVHGTCVAIDGAGVLLRGPSGSGKSDLALRLIDGGATLVADDQVLIEARDGALVAEAPASIANRLEVRGLGIVEAPTAPARLRLLVDLMPPDDVSRLPEPRTGTITGTEGTEGTESIALPVLALAPFEASAAAKVRRALALHVGG